MEGSTLKTIGKIIAKYKVLVILVCVALLVPSAIGYMRTKVNYDILSYLPDSLETVYGQDIMVQDFGKGAFSMVIVEGMGKRDTAKLEEAMEAVDHVEEVLWYDDILGLDVPQEMLPERIRKVFFKGDAPKVPTDELWGIYTMTPTALTTHARKGAKGWRVNGELPTTWCGRPIIFE
jgi:hypothetical protein